MNNCTCNKNDELRIVRGNAFAIRLTVSAIHIDGTPVENFVLGDSEAVLKVMHLDAKTPKEFIVIGNDAIIRFGGDLSLGWYGLEMTGTFNGKPWRWCVPQVFQVVETNAKANIPAWAVMTDETYAINGVMTITSGDIYQSDWNETDPQSPSYIKNKPTKLADFDQDSTHRVVSDEQIAAWNAKYDKPSGGIPKSDLDSSVQTSLGKADTAIQDVTQIENDIADIEALIPAQATPQNQLADKQYVDDGISTASATYRGAYNLVSDLELTTAATEQQIAAALATVMAAATPPIVPDNNDYCFVQVPTADATPTEIARVDRYKYNGTAWAFEFSLNNSGFTAAQWAALNSGITSGLVTKLSDLPTIAELTTLLNGKEDNSNKVTSLSAESTDTQYPSAKCVYDLHKQNADDIDAIEEKIPSGASSSNKMATASDITNLSDSIAAILLLIPSAASSLNQLADKAFVNSSIATNTATYRGSYNLVSDLSLTISATEQQIAAALATKMTALSITPENNDYCFVQVPTADATPTEISRIDRYKYNGTAWLYEYSLNNSSFTSAQWAAINSGITSALVVKLSALPTNAELTTALGVLTDGIAAINAKIPSAATSSNKLVDNTAMQSYVAQIVNALDATFNITSSDGHVTVQITQTNGVITALAITTSDIASAAALNLLSGRVTTAEGNISTNATDIANLQQLYNDLQQSDPIIIEPTDTWPVANPSTHDIYRVIDRVNTPPQYYSDYMWNGTTMVLMAQYDNAIDDEPTPGSNNLVKSGGVAANIVYDISRANASGSTLATYADLAAALGTNGANVPASIRRGGMSVKFVQSSDNKYVQYRLMADEWSTNTDNWSFCGDDVLVENPEYIAAWLDAEGKLLAGRTPDGAAFENVGFSAPKVSIDGHIIENIEDPEGRSEITTDTEGKIISYRDADGVRHEECGIEAKEVSTDSLKLSDSGMTDFQQALKNAGFQPGGGGDWSDREVIELPEPKHYSLLNVEVDNLPINDSDVSEGYIEYYDSLGNYFKTTCELAAQGQTSRIFARTGGKGNYTLDLPKDVKFGNWVPQDSFHLKGCAKDVTRGYLATSYKWAYKMLEYLDAKPNRVLLKDNKITTLSASGDSFTDWGDGARCLPDGFPVEVYLNGEYWGLYALQLKKHRKNYSMKKSDYTSFFLDPDNFMNPSTGEGFWRNDIWWERIEIRNPKDLVCMDGTAYDGDNPKELIDSTSEFWNPDNAKHVGSANTKQIIQSWPSKYQEVKDLINNSDIEGAKNLFNQYFDYNACMFVYIFNCLNNNADSIGKNTLWATYKNGKISPMLWDLDGMYGEGWIGNIAGGPNAELWTGIYANAEWPLSLFWRLYEAEIKAVYSELRDNKIISVETWHNVVFNQWVNRIGEEAYKRDVEKWDETPSYRKNYTNTDYWEELGFNYYNSSIPEWDENTNYSTNEIVCIKESHSDQYMCYKAKVNSTGVCPVTKFYNRFPSLGGYYNSPKRMQKWITKQIELCDSVMGYNL